MAKKPPARAKPAKPTKGAGSGAAKGRKSGKSPAKPAAKPTPKPAKVASKPAKAAVTSKKPDAKPTAVKGSAPAKSTIAPKAPAPTKSATKPATTAKPTTPPKGSPAKPTVALQPPANGKPASSTKPTPPIKPEAGGKVGQKPVPGGASKAPAAVVPAPAAVAAPVIDPKTGRKGITIVSKPRRSGPRQEKIQIPKMEPLLGPGSPFRKPLIASGPGAVRHKLEIDPESLASLKSPFGKKDLQRFRDILLKKRADLIGDVSDLESEALLGRSGSLSSLPQHIAEQGSETYEQSLSLNLAAEDRRLIREIDAALQRVDKGTFGICEMTGKPISRERLEELPWTRFSIEAAREFERRSMGGR